MRKKAALISLIAMTSFSLVVTFLGAFAWFVNSVSLGNMNISGESDETYFAYGKGTEAEPFGINTPRHLYNLSWLQFAGLFNKDANNDGKVDKQYYFEIDPNLSGELNMSGWTIPPIGTETYPFVGTFNGNNKVISNLTVSNQSSFDKKPESITYNSSNQPEVVGFFGVVGDLPEEETATSVVSIHNFTLKNTTVKSTTEHVLIGLAAGYVNSDMSGVKVDGTATIDVNGRTTSAKTDYSTKLSDYGLVGYTTKTGSTGEYKQKLSEVYQQGKATGPDTGWGGSIDSRSYNTWIYNLYLSSVTNNVGDVYEYSSMKAGTDSTYNFNTMQFSDFKLKFATAYRTGVYPTNQGNKYTQYNNYMNPDYFNEPPDGHPVRSATGASMVYQLKDDCYIPLRFNDNQDGTHTKNTGYIVGGSHGSASSILGSPKLSSYYYSAIGNSLQKDGWVVGTAVANKTLGYTDSNLEVLTYKNGWKRISDSHNENNTVINDYLTGYSKETVASLGLGKYNDARNTIQTVCESSGRMHGIHFESVEVAANNKITVPTAKINSQTYQNYDLLKGSIQFNLKENGFINFFAGTYYTSTKYFNFFSLYHIERSGGTITAAKRIKEIYLNSASSSPKYVYKYNDNTYSTGTAGTLVYNVATTLEADAPVNNALYYFEVPVNQGEYAMGMVPGKASSYTGAYMIYLDLGTNGQDKDKISAYSITTIANSNTFPLGVDFVPITTSGNGGDTIAVSVIPGQGTVVFTVTSNNISVTNSASLASYAYRNATNYVASGPGSGQFTCNLTGDPPNIAAGGIRVLSIELTTLANAEYSIRITDNLNSNGTIASSTYEVDSGSGFEPSNESTVSGLSTDENYSLSAFRGLTIAAILTRATGTSDFTTTYNLDDCSFEDKIVDVNIALNGTTISSVVTTGYTFTPHYV